MSLEKLLAGIETRGRQECDAILAQADEQARNLLDQARLEAERITSDILDAGDPELEMKRTRLQGEQELKRIKLRARVKADLIEKAYAGASAEFTKLRAAKDYHRILTELLEEAIRPECTYVQVFAKDLELMKSIVHAKGLACEVVPSNQEVVGVIVGRKTKGIKEFDVLNTMHSRLDRIRDALNIQLNRVLFGSAEQT